MELLKKREKAGEDLGDKDGLSRCLWNMGGVLKDMGRHHEAIRRRSRAIRLEKALRSPDVEKDVRSLKAYVREAHEKGWLKNQG